MTIVQIAVDIGGTFTDVALLHDDDTVETLKVPTSSSEPAAAVRTALDRSVPSTADRTWARMIHATTVATNALLEDKTPRVALLTTRGFRDVLQLRRLKRSDVTSLGWAPPEPLVSRDLIFEVDERISGDGAVIAPLVPDELDRVVDWLVGNEIESVAICLLHSYVNDAHEAALGEHLRARLPQLHVTCSSGVSPEIGEYERTSTTVVHAALKPVMSDYLRELDDVSRGTAGSRLFIMQSSGGLATSAQIIDGPAAAVESGPAAGALYAAELSRRHGVGRAIAFDMGGTTAKACLIEDGVPAETSELRVGGEMHGGAGFKDAGGYLVRGRSVDLVEVGAGGGSVCRVDAQGVLHVGPQSAGADPGPVAYRRGGTVPTVTDASLVLGIFPDGDSASGIALDAASARAAIREQIAEPLGLSTEDAAWLIMEVANSNMMRAIQAVSSERGRDPSQCTLVCFGGAGPSHAALMAADLGMAEVLIPHDADTFSAVGLHSCTVRRDVQASLQVLASELDDPTLDEHFVRLEREQRRLMEADGLGDVAFERMVDVRFVGQHTSITMPAPASADQIAPLFVEAHEVEYAHANPHVPVEVVALRLRASVALGEGRRAYEPAVELGEATPARVYCGPRTGWVDALRFPATALDGGSRIDGPALIQLTQATVFVPPAATAWSDEVGNVRLRVEPKVADTLPGGWEGRAGLQLFSNRLGSALDRMAHTVARTATSPIISDGHDFSVGITDAAGNVLDQGLGSLIHLGSVPSALQAMSRSELAALDPGDVVLLNDPYSGGTHLPDCMVVAPAHVDDQLVGYTVAMGHLSEIGGHSRASSWASGATELLQEGIVIPPVKFYERGEANRAVHQLIERNVRVPDEVIGDLEALVAAARSGAAAFARIVRDAGVSGARSQMAELLNYGAERGREELSRLGEATGSFVDHLDDDGAGGGPVAIHVELTIREGRVHVDFAGTSNQRHAGVNCTMSSTRSAVLYCIRSLLPDDCPDNAGLHSLVEVAAGPGCVVNAVDDAPVTNRGMTALRIVECVFGALATTFPDRVAAAGEGQLDPIAFAGVSDDGRPFTMVDMIAGATGARPNADGIEGASPAVGNTQNMSIEGLERRFPGIRVLHYLIEPSTGGRGRFRGANAISRGYEVLCEWADLFYRIDRQAHPPWGLAGGEHGSPARSLLLTADGRQEELTGWQTRRLGRGDRIIRWTAGGGGHGPAAQRHEHLRRRDVREERVAD